MLDAAKADEERRFHDILANSGEEMESGERHDLENLYVMGVDGKLIKISDLNTDPEKQTEDYNVQAQADHGEYDAVADTPVPTIEKVFGNCRVWLEEDGLHARMYFANDDTLADHAWAIARTAGYSTGIWVYEDGYHEAGNDIDGEMGILREISMVVTGNDPRAKALDQLNAEATSSEGAGEAKVDNNKLKKGKEMSVTKKDELTADERDALIQGITSAVDQFVEKENATADEAEAPAEAPAEAEEAKEETPAEEKKDSLHMPVVVINSATKAQPSVKAVKKDWLHSKDAHIKFADTLRSVGRFGGAFDAAWNTEVRKHTDGISGLATPAPVEQMFVNALAKSDGIISHFRNVNSKSLRVNAMYATNDEGGRAKGHTKGQTKAFQDITNTYRDVLVRMIYKKLDLDPVEIYENPEIIDFRAQELVEAYIREIERGAFIGDGRSSATPDYRIFDGTRGIQPIATDTAAVSGIGTYLAGAVEAGKNFYESAIKAKNALRTDGGVYVVAKSSVITDFMTATVSANSSQYLVAPGTRPEDVLGVARIYTPSWMDNASDDAYFVVDGAYALIGEANPASRTDFDTTTNADILLVEGAKGGSLTQYKSAIAVKSSDSE